MKPATRILASLATAGAVAAYASGGRAALTALGGGGDAGARLLLERLGGR